MVNWWILIFRLEYFDLNVSLRWEKNAFQMFFFSSPLARFIKNLAMICTILWFLSRNYSLNSPFCTKYKQAFCMFSANIYTSEKWFYFSHVCLYNFFSTFLFSKCALNTRTQPHLPYIFFRFDRTCPSIIYDALYLVVIFLCLL